MSNRDFSESEQGIHLQPVGSHDTNPFTVGPQPAKSMKDRETRFTIDDIHKLAVEFINNFFIGFGKGNPEECLEYLSIFINWLKNYAVEQE